jgi:hypothetical protein
VLVEGVVRRYDAQVSISKTGVFVEPELGARVRYRGRCGTVTQKQLIPTARRLGDLLPAGRRFVVLFLDPGPDGRGEQIQLCESDWAEIEPAEE